jgi:hypothetical protein
MAIQILNARFTVRNDSAEKWESSNPILLKGEIGLENDTSQFKFGDDVTPWNELKHVTLPLNPETPVVESLKINGELLKKNEDGSIELPLASAGDYGLVKPDNETLSADNGVLSISKLSVDKLYVKEDSELILDGDHA